MLTRDRFGFGSSAKRFDAPGRSACIGADGDRHTSSAFSRVASPLVSSPSLVTAVNADLAARPSSAMSRPPSALDNSATADRDSRSLGVARSDEDTRKRPGSALSLLSAGTASPDAEGATRGLDRSRRPASAEFVTLLQRRRAASEQVHALRRRTPALGTDLSLASGAPSSSPLPSQKPPSVQSVSGACGEASFAPDHSCSTASPSAAYRSQQRAGAATPDRHVAPATRTGIRFYGGFGFRSAKTKAQLVAERTEAARHLQGHLTADGAAKRRVEHALSDAASATLTTARSPDVAVRPSVADIAASMRRPHSYLSDAHLSGTTCISMSRNVRIRQLQAADKKFKAAALPSW